MTTPHWKPMADTKEQTGWGQERPQGVHVKPVPDQAGQQASWGTSQWDQEDRKEVCTISKPKLGYIFLTVPTVLAGAAGQSINIRTIPEEPDIWSV